MQKGLAASSWGAAREMHDPGYMYFGASLGREGNRKEGKPVVDRAQCTGCTLCLQACKFGAIGREQP